MKMLSINLWFQKYKNKTLAQLSSFRRKGYDTYVATVYNSKDILECHIFKVSNDNIITPVKKSNFKKGIRGYIDSFRFIFDFCKEEHFDLIYVRRLMSKLIFAYKQIITTGKSIPIVYEIPTYPLDTGDTFLYKLRDFIEMSLFKTLQSRLLLTVVILRDNIVLPDKWVSFHNGIDISTYAITPVPVFNNELCMLAVANVAEWHGYDRILKAMHDYKGEYILHLTVISPENDTYLALKNLANALDIGDYVDFCGPKDINEIKTIAASHHIGIAQLSRSEHSSRIVNTIKTKEYCAMGLPFVTSCHDTSFRADYPYMKLLEDMDAEICIDDLISWYSKIYQDNKYRSKMFEYAESNLQFDSLADSIQNALNHN